MNVLDENIIASQCEQLRRWRIAFRQIGHDIGRKGMNDKDDILPLLHRLPQPTLFTRDADFYDHTLCHPGYCLVILVVSKDEAAQYIRRFLRHREFRTRAKRLGRVVRLSAAGIIYWQRNALQEQAVTWAPTRRTRNVRRRR